MHKKLALGINKPTSRARNMNTRYVYLSAIFKHRHIVWQHLNQLPTSVNCYFCQGHVDYPLETQYVPIITQILALES